MPTPLDQARALLYERAGKMPELSTSVVEHAPIDEYVFNDLKQRGDRFRDAMERTRVGESDIELAPDLWADVFHALHNARPNVTLTDPMDVRQDHQLFHRIMGQAVEEPDFRAAKARARGDRLLSAMIAMEIQRVLEPALANDLSEAVEDAENVREAIERMQDADQRGDQEAAAQAQQEIASAIDQFETHGIMVPTSAIAEAAAEEARAIADTWADLPGTGDGDNRRIEPDRALRLARRWRDTAAMRVMSIVVGRMERSMKAARRKDVKSGREQRTGITVGNDLARTLSSELVHLTRPATRSLFLKKYVNRGLLQYDTKGTERAGLGPQVLVLDNSGSMKKDCGGVKRFEGAAGVAMALLALGHKDGRATYIIMLRENVVGEWKFDGRTIDLEQLTDFGSREPGGGTDLTSGMRRAEELIATHSDFRKADVVLMTDGADTIGQEDRDIRDRLRERGVQTHGVVIGMRETQYTNTICDTAVSVTDLSGPSEATDHLAVVTAG